MGMCCLGLFQSLVIPEKFQHILRVMGTNIDGKRKVMFAMTAIKGVGRRYANIVLKKADIDLDKRAGECTDEEVSSSHNLSSVTVAEMNASLTSFLSSLVTRGYVVGWHKNFIQNNIK